ncbi:hypothetical protein IBTHAUMO2_220004 [Nitrosopumilaceae archaeon]|nr:hypothetical protein IBTHAUMO2_220004 [Nitrosopumilaceae archaeon]
MYHNNRTDATPVWFGGDRLAGYSTVSMSKEFVTYYDMNDGVRPKEGPVILSEGIARSRDSPKGTGRHILHSIMGFVRDISEYIGCSGILLHPLNEDLVGYYKSNGFRSLESSKNMFWGSD